MIGQAPSRSAKLARLAPPALTIFFTFATLMCAAAGWSLLAPEGPAAAIWAIKRDQYRELLALGPWVGVGFLLLAAIMAVTAVGCFAAKRWGWRLAVALIGLNALADFGRALADNVVEGLVGFVIAAAVLWVLTRPAVRQMFT